MFKSAFADAFYAVAKNDARQAFTILEGIAVNCRYGFRNNQLGDKLVVYVQILCVVQRIRILIYKGDIQPCLDIRNRYARQVRTVVKSIGVNTLYTIAKRYACHFFALIKRPFAKLRYPVAKLQAFQIRAPSKRIATNCPYTVGDAYAN